MKTARSSPFPRSLRLLKYETRVALFLAWSLGALSLLRPGIVSSRLRHSAASALPLVPPKLAGVAFVATLAKYIGTQ